MKQERDSVGSKRQKGTGEAKEIDDIEVFRTSLTNFPDDIIISILLLLPIKSILICKTVCKEWCTIISNPLFAQWHLQCAPMDVFVRDGDLRSVSRTLYLLDFEHKSTEAQNLVDDSDCGHICSCICSCKDFLNPNCSNHTKLEVKFKLPLRDNKMVPDTMLENRNKGRKNNCNRFDVVNACNGLLCLCDPADGNPLVICNPITGEFTRLPKASKKIRKRNFYNCGFGYLRKTNKYKVIRICNHYVQHRGDLYMTYINTVVEIHSLGSGLWEKIKCYANNWWWFQRPTCFNGSLYWLVYYHIGVSILRFDLESETFIQYPSPPLSSTFDKRMENINFGEIKGSLCICCPLENCLTIWTMKTYGVDHSWTKLININATYCGYWNLISSPIAFLVGAGILIHHSCRSFIYLDLQKRKCKSFDVRGTKYLDLIVYIPSLIKLKDAVKEGSIEVLNFHSRCATFKLREDTEILIMAKTNAQIWRL